MAILTAQERTKRFGGLVAVDELDVEIKEQSIHSIIGPNGAGKTTFFNCVTGFYRPEEGEILLNGHSLVGLLPDQIVRLGIARTYQNIRLFPNLTAMENILVGLHCHLRAGYFGIVVGLPSTRKEEKDGRRRGADDSSGSSTWREREISWPRIFPMAIRDDWKSPAPWRPGPKLLLLDEPTAGMNPSETQTMMDFIRHLRDELGITILLIEHQMRVVMGISETVTVLDYGKKIAEGHAGGDQEKPEGDRSLPRPGKRRGQTAAPA